MSSLLDLDQDTYETVVRWRQHTSSQLAHIWQLADHDEAVHVVVIFGSVHSNRPLQTPLWRAVAEDHELDDIALEFWEQMWMVPHPQILDFKLKRRDMRAAIVTSRPIDEQLVRYMLDCICDNAVDNLPDYLLTV